MNKRASIVWFESDLRTADNPALHRAAAVGGPIVPVFVWDGGTGFAEGSASRWWLHQSLVSLHGSLRALGLDLVVRRGSPAGTLLDLCRETDACRVLWNIRREPEREARDRAVAESLRSAGVDVRVFGGQTLHEPEEVRTGSGGPYQVFTPFQRKISSLLEIASPLPAPPCDATRAPGRWPATEPVGALGLLPRIDWAAGIRRSWTPGEPGALSLLQVFVDSALTGYADFRDRPDREGTSRLSPHLHFGEVSARQVWHAVRSAWGTDPRAEPWLRQILWREFAFHLLHHFPDTPNRPLRPAYEAFPWREDPAGLALWQKGLTGYPIVDAGMRELWHTGWMHNRVRMIVASFLTKDLLIGWRHGAAWFADTLVDADQANNTLGWQWAAGCGADAQPFFRIFNPVRQGQKFDPNGAYVRRWVPELARLPDRWLQEPWNAPGEVMRSAGVRLGDQYPAPVVDHAEARLRALAAWDQVKRGR